MKLRNKVLASFIAAFFIFSMMAGSALASTHILPYDYPEDANVATNNDVWVVLYGGTAAPPLTNDTSVRDAIRSVDVVISGKATFDAEIITNGPSWVPYTFAGQEVDGVMSINVKYDMTDLGYAEVVVNLKNKSEGPLQITRMDFKDADGNVVFTHGLADESSTPKTGVVSTALFFGLGAAVLGTGAVILKKKED